MNIIPKSFSNAASFHIGAHILKGYISFGALSKEGSYGGLSII